MSLSVNIPPNHILRGGFPGFIPQIVACCLSVHLILGIQAELNDAAALLTALQNGEPLPEVTGKASELPGKINALNDGLADLNSGVQALAEGAAELDSGLATLSANSEALNDGADDIFSAILETANQQLAASGLAEAGISIFSFRVSLFSLSGCPSRRQIVAFSKSRASKALPQASGTLRSTFSRYIPIETYPGLPHCDVADEGV